MLATLGFCADCKNKETGSTSTSSTTPVPTSAVCASLTRLQCYSSSHCFLDYLGPYRYACRDKRGPCEVDIWQTDKASCENRRQCEWKPGNCYCPFAGYGETAVKDPGVAAGACACGGGPPSMCVERAAKNAGDATAK